MSQIKLFNSQKIRTHWDREKEDWYFSVVDVCGVLSESAIPRNYWSDLKRKLKTEGSELHEKIVQLKMLAEDGKMRETDVLDTKGILRLVQSIPSPNAEPFKVWLAQVGSERIDEMFDPEKAIQRALDYYRKKGYTEAWINQRLRTIDMRKELTDEWKEGGVETHFQYAMLTDDMTRAWSGMTTREYKDLKGLNKENLRDNMTNIELVINMLAEVTATTIERTRKTKDIAEHTKIAREGGRVARVAKDEFESSTGVKVISDANAKNKEMLIVETKEMK